MMNEETIETENAPDDDLDWTPDFDEDDPLPPDAWVCRVCGERFPEYGVQVCPFCCSEDVEALG